ncbi:DnaJ C-terminal domain-containing protein [Roseibium sp. RKSG952]|uniref:DnaJ C-terminal domain-containing protein n=1 Tax=Roseibium sp. RKSG952 TaxID=2529384 RepID=UPI0012BB8817|nr:J domain-containing protein [Roseibium sp. RKSG952]MTI01026.1 J domain-containing protein [Roseibium sp. RKSG952]
MSDDPYSVLGVSKNASDAEIKKAYRRIAKECHPDLKPGDAEAEAKFKAAAAAYDLLKDPETRARYDNGEIDASGQERPQQHYYREYSEAAGNPYRSGATYGDPDDMSDIFAEFMRNRGQGGFGQQRTHEFHAPGHNLNYSLQISFLDAVFGASQKLTLPDGDRIEVKIPAGITDGQTIRLRGKGAPGYGEGPPGDALVTISVAEHPVFERKGDDIHISLPITIDEAVLGGKVPAPTIDGGVNVSVPAGTSSGKTLRLRGKGVKKRGSSDRGDQLIELTITMPDKIDDELKQFMETWRETHSYDPRKGMPS